MANGLVSYFKNAAREINIGASLPNVVTSTEAPTVFAFLAAVGAATANPVMAGVGAAGLALCLSHLKSQGESALNPAPVAPAAKPQ